MRVFVTGAAGFIGSATVAELVKHGHKVLGLVRTDAQAEALTKAGGEPHRGSIEDLESLKSGAKASDGVVHLAFIHDFQNFPHGCAVDRAAIQAMGEVMAGTGKPLIISSGTLGFPSGELATEDTEKERNHPPFSDRELSIDLIVAMSKEKDVRGMVMRFAPTVHGAGDKGFIPTIVKSCLPKNVLVYPGDGSARWPTVHRADAAVVLRLALEKGTAGAIYHACAEEGVAVKDFMTVSAKRLGLPVEGKPREEAMGTLGFFANVMSMDNPTSSEKTRKELGWKPTQPGLLADIEANYSFQ